MKRQFLPAVVLALAASGAVARPSPRSAAPAPMVLLGKSPTEIHMVFSEPLDPTMSSLELKAPGGADVPLGPVTVDPSDPRRIAATVPAPLTRGSYTVHWRAAGRDGRPAKGDYMFEVQ